MLTFPILGYIVLCFMLVSCNRAQIGQRNYEMGVRYYELSDHGDYHDQPELDTAIAYFEKAIEIGFKERDVFEKLAWSYNGSFVQDIENMERVYTLALTHFSNDVEFYFRRGNCRMNLGKYRAAYGDFNCAILLDTGQHFEYISNAFYERGALSFLFGDTLNADRNWKTAQKSSKCKLRPYPDYCRRFDLSKSIK